MNVTGEQIEDWFFEKKCPVRDIKLVKDKNKNFKGLAYIEFYQKSSVSSAIEFSGSDFKGRSLFIEESQADKNREFTAKSLSSVSSSIMVGIIKEPEPSSPIDESSLLRLYVGNFDYGITEEMARDLLGQFGPMAYCKLQTEPNGQSKGYAFVEYYSKEHAILAFNKLNTVNISNRPIRCNFTKRARMKNPDLPPSPPPLYSHRSLNQPGSEKKDSINGDYQVHLDDNNLKNNQSRIQLIQLLAASGSSGGSQPNLNKNLPSPGNPTCCICLKNMFDPTTENSIDFDKEIQIDVLEEANTFGKVVHIFVDKNSFVCINYKL